MYLKLINSPNQFLQLINNQFLIQNIKSKHWNPKITSTVYYIQSIFSLHLHPLPLLPLSCCSAFFFLNLFEASFFLSLQFFTFHQLCTLLDNHKGSWFYVLYCLMFMSIFLLGMFFVFLIWVPYILVNTETMHTISKFICYVGMLLFESLMWLWEC